MARSSLLPTIGLQGQYSGRNQDIPGGALSTTGIPAGNRTVIDATSHGWTVSLSQTVFDWGQFKTMDQANKRVAQAETTYGAARQDLINRVSTRYFTVLQSEDNLASAQSAREAISRQLEQAQRRFEVGLIAITDVQQAQAAYDTAVATEIGARNGMSMVVRIEGNGVPQKTIQPVFQSDGYISRVEAWILPQLLIRAGVTTDFGFYSYQSDSSGVTLRRDVLEQPSDKPNLWKLTTKLTEDKPSQTSYYNAKGELIRTEMSDGSVWVPTTYDELYKLWQSKHMPLGKE